MCPSICNLWGRLHGLECRHSWFLKAAINQWYSLVYLAPRHTPPAQSFIDYNLIAYFSPRPSLSRVEITKFFHKLTTGSDECPKSANLLIPYSHITHAFDFLSHTHIHNPATNLPPAALVRICRLDTWDLCRFHGYQGLMNLQPRQSLHHTSQHRLLATAAVDINVGLFPQLDVRT